MRYIMEEYVKKDLLTCLNLKTPHIIVLLVGKVPDIFFSLPNMYYII